MVLPGEVFADPSDFDFGIRQLVPHYDEMLDVLVSCLPEDAEQVLELGCGTGELTIRILYTLPKVKLVAVDYSPRMLRQMQRKVTSVGLADRVTCIEADFGAWGDRGYVDFPGWPSPSPVFDACVSSLAIHHLDDVIKQRLFGRIHENLRSGGCFWNADPMAPESAAVAAIQQRAKEVWQAQQKIDPEQIQTKRGVATPFGYSAQDRLTSMLQHLHMLQKSGFTSVFVPWKYYGLAIVGGFRP